MRHLCGREVSDSPKVTEQAERKTEASSWGSLTRGHALSTSIDPRHLLEGSVTLRVRTFRCKEVKDSFTHRLPPRSAFSVMWQPEGAVSVLKL